MAGEPQAVWGRIAFPRRDGYQFRKEFAVICRTTEEVTAIRAQLTIRYHGANADDAVEEKLADLAPSGQYWKFEHSVNFPEGYDQATVTVRLTGYRGEHEYPQVLTRTFTVLSEPRRVRAAMMGIGLDHPSPCPYTVTTSEQMNGLEASGQSFDGHLVTSATLGGVNSLDLVNVGGYWFAPFAPTASGTYELLVTDSGNHTQRCEVTVP